MAKVATHPEPAPAKGLQRITQLMVMPQDGVESVVTLFAGAKTSLTIKMFTFGSEALFTAVGDAVKRGVKVRIMLNAARSSGDRANDAAMDRLLGLGADAKWANPAFVVTHEKSAVLDDNRVLIATFNFMDKYFTHTRDYGIVTDDPAAVEQVAACFKADWDHVPFQPRSTFPLTFSSLNSRATMAAVIDEAKHTLRIQHPKYSDVTIIDRLLDARERGVEIRVLCGGHHGISDSDKLDTYSALRTLARAGIPVRRQHKLRLHAKLIIADRAVVMTGSMNIDRSAFDLRRELGAVVTDKDAVLTFRHQFRADWEEAAHYEAPDPLIPEHPEADPPINDVVGADPAYDHD